MISSATFGNGSFGFHKPNAHIITVWFCGGRKPEADGKVHQHSINSVCAHRTRDDARKCSRKA